MVSEVLPWVLQDVDLEGPVLEIGPGPGVVTAALAQFGIDDLTTLEIDPGAARRLEQRIGSRVRVAVGDAAAMPFLAASFATVVSCTMLHHVPTSEAQDRVLAESRRVLVPGGTLAGSDSLTSIGFRLFHLFDTHNPVDPDGLPARLVAAGFDDVGVEVAQERFRFRAVAPS